MNKARITALSIKNVKSVRAVDITPEGDVTEIRGDSGQGKTTIIQAIRGAIEGLDPSMIRNGESAGEITLETSLANINRIIHAEGGKDYVSVTDPETGKGIEKAKDFLKSIFGKQAFNPLDWVQLGGGDNKGRTERLRMQRDQLLTSMPVTIEPAFIKDKILDLGEDVLAQFAEVNLDGVEFDDQHALVVCSAIQKACYEYRKALNKAKESAENRLEAHPAPETAAPKKTLEECSQGLKQASEAYYSAKGLVDARPKQEAQCDALKERIEDAEKNTPSKAQVAKDREDTEAAINSLETKIETIKAELEKAQNELESTNNVLNAIAQQERRVANLAEDKQRLAEIEAELGDLPDIDALRSVFERAEKDVNARAMQDVHDEAATTANKAREKAERFDKLVALFRDDMPREIINSMDMPVEGLGVDGDVVTLHGIPLHQLGTSEQIRVGVRIAAALNPRAGFITVDGAESLGRADRRTLAEEAAELGVQLIMTYVDPDAVPAPGVVVMRDGQKAA